jgi:hypothetical protein
MLVDQRRLDVGWFNRRKLPADMMGASAGLIADQAARNIGATAFDLTNYWIQPIPEA